MIVSDIDCNNSPGFLAVFMKYKALMPAADLKELQAASPRFAALDPMKIAAVYDEEQDMVSITIGCPSYEISDKLKFMGAKMQPDSDYKLFHFQCTEDHPISYVQRCKPTFQRSPLTTSGLSA